MSGWMANGSGVAAVGSGWVAIGRIRPTAMLCGCEDIHGMIGMGGMLNAGIGVNFLGVNKR